MKIEYATRETDWRKFARISFSDEDIAEFRRDLKDSEFDDVEHASDDFVRALRMYHLRSLQNNNNIFKQ